MNPAYAHVILTHVPLYGVLFGLALLVAGMLLRNDTLKKTSLVFFSFGAVTVVPVYLTGEPAERVMKSLPDVSVALIGAHAIVAQLALVATLALGLLSALSFWVYPRYANRRNVLLVIVMLVALVSAGFLIRTANLGGYIRHLEFRSVGALQDVALTQDTYPNAV